MQQLTNSPFWPAYRLLLKWANEPEEENAGPAAEAYQGLTTDPAKCTFAPYEFKRVMGALPQDCAHLNEKQTRFAVDLYDTTLSASLQEKPLNERLTELEARLEAARIAGDDDIWLDLYLKSLDLDYELVRASVEGIS